MGKKFYGLTGSRLNWTIGIIAGLDFLLFGYDQGVMGGLLDLPVFYTQFPDIALKYVVGDPNVRYPTEVQYPTDIYNKHSTYQGISVAAYNVGCFLGAVATIWIGNYLGRRKTIFVGSIIMTIGATLQCTAFSLPHFIVGRIITGIGNGLNTSTVPTWQSETSKSHKRGQLVMIEGALITCGIMISYWIDFGMSFAAPSQAAWRFPIAFQIVFALIIFGTILGLPESPRWLILKGREDEAMEVLVALNELPPEDPYIQNEFLAIKETVLEMSKGSFRDLFTMDENRHFHRTALAYINQMFQQISGINLITYYAATIYQNSLGFDGVVSRLVAACNGTEYFLASWIAVFTVEKVGRRKLMLIGAAGMSISMAVLAATTRYGGLAPGAVAAAFLFIFNTFFAIGWLGMTWLYPAEIVPLRIRAPANALATSANWLFNFMVVMITPVAFANIKYQTYIIFAVINAFIFPFTYFFFPETRLRSLEEMDSIFRKSNNWFDVVSIARNEPNRYDKSGNMVISYNETDDHHRRQQSISSERKNSGQFVAQEKTADSPSGSSQKDV